MTKVLLSGGAGFIGHHVAETILRVTDWNVTFLDRLDFAGNLSRIAAIEEWERHKTRCRWAWHDLRAPINEMLMRQIGAHDIILHLGAMTHVDRAIRDPVGAVHDNVLGSVHMLEFARHAGCDRFVYFSTDEVFGPAPDQVRYEEWDRYRSTNPYSATKAGGEELAIAYHNTYRLPVIVTHTMNVYGRRQHREKFIPSTIRKVRDGEIVLIHADATRTRPGSRFYIHASDVGNAVLFLLINGECGDKYNIVGESEIDNLELAAMIADRVGAGLKYDLVDFHSARPGHDLRYALDGSKMEAMGWRPLVELSVGLADVVGWSLMHPEWL